MTCNLTAISLKLTYGSHMSSFATNFCRVIRRPPVCQLGEFHSHFGVCAEIIRLFYTRRWPKNPLNWLVIWELDGHEIGYLALSASQHICTSQQGVWEHIISLRRELRNEKQNHLSHPVLRFRGSGQGEKYTWFRQQVYYLSSSSLSNPGITLQYRSAILFH